MGTQTGTWKGTVKQTKNYSVKERGEDIVMQYRDNFLPYRKPAQIDKIFTEVFFYWVPKLFKIAFFGLIDSE